MMIIMIMMMIMMIKMNIDETQLILKLGPADFAWKLTLTVLYILI